MPTKTKSRTRTQSKTTTTTFERFLLAACVGGAALAVAQMIIPSSVMQSSSLSLAKKIVSTPKTIPPAPTLMDFAVNSSDVTFTQNPDSSASFSIPWKNIGAAPAVDYGTHVNIIFAFGLSAKGATSTQYDLSLGDASHAADITVDGYRTYLPTNVNTTGSVVTKKYMSIQIPINTPSGVITGKVSAAFLKAHPDAALLWGNFDMIGMISESDKTNNAFVAPLIPSTVTPSAGTLTIQADSNPVNNIVVAGKVAWVRMAQYRATALGEAMNIDRIAVAAKSPLHADNADFRQIAIAQNGIVLGTGILGLGTSGNVVINVSGELVAPKDSYTDFQIWAQFDDVHPFSVVSGASNVARSGDAPALGLASGLTTGDWDSNYVGKLNVSATGATSGKRIYADSGAAFGNYQVLRKTMPIVTKQSLSSTTLMNVDQDLMKFQVAADAAGSVALKQVVFTFSKTPGVTLSNFRMRRGYTDMDTSVYAVTNGATGADLMTGSLSKSQASGYIVFALKPGQEDSIAGSGNVYTLHATVSGAVSGENVTLTFYRDPAAPVVTGYLNNASAFGGFASSANIYNIDTAATPSGSSKAVGSFLWSDNSELPHSSAPETSRDWTNDVYIPDLSQSQTLSL